MTITQLQVLIKTIELGSFTKAARVLNMTQPAVSHAISSIESELGVTILIRDKRQGLLVTDVGNRILVHIREILNGVEKIEQEVAMEKGHEVGTIRIGSFPSASAHFLPKMINHFKEKYPSLEVVLCEGTIKEVEDWLISRVVDIGIVILPNKEMEIVPLTKGKMVAILERIILFVRRTLLQFVIWRMNRSYYVRADTNHPSLICLNKPTYHFGLSM